MNSIGSIIPDKITNIVSIILKTMIIIVDDFINFSDVTGMAKEEEAMSGKGYSPLKKQGNFGKNTMCANPPILQILV